MWKFILNGDLLLTFTAVAAAAVAAAESEQFKDQREESAERGTYLENKIEEHADINCELIGCLTNSTRTMNMVSFE